MRTLWQVFQTERCTDGELLRAFVSHKSEAAFKQLVQRHGSLVQGICRRTLGHTQDAEDAFQATFLTLVRTLRTRRRDRERPLQDLPAADALAGPVLPASSVMVTVGVGVLATF